MAKGKTLWEMLTGKFIGPTELKYYNPLKARIGNAVQINEIDWKDNSFFLKEIREYKRRAGGQQFLSVDYILLCRPLHGEDIWVRLRLNPVDDPTRVAGLTHNVLLLRLDDELAYDEGLHNVVRDSTKKFQVLENGQVAEEYWRINDVGDSYTAKVAVLRDVNNDGTVDEDEVDHIEIEYWDYWREIKDIAGQPLTQYLFVEMNKDNGWFQIWKGQEIDPAKVMVM
jgi:hypothetical protein